MKYNTYIGGNSDKIKFTSDTLSQNSIVLQSVAVLTVRASIR